MMPSRGYGSGLAGYGEDGGGSSVPLRRTARREVRDAATRYLLKMTYSCLCYSWRARSVTDMDMMVGYISVC